MKKFIHIVQNIRGFIRRISDDHVSAFAAQSAYFILMSIIPILLLMLYMMRYLPITQTDIVDLFFVIVPEEFKSLYMIIID